MSDLRKAAEQALEALDCLPWKASPIAIEATKALRTALAQTEQKYDYRIKYDRPCYKCLSNFCPGNCKAPEHLTQPIDTVNTSQEPIDTVNTSQEPIDTIKQEPAFWLVQYKDRHEFVWGAKPVFRGGTVLGLKPLYTAPPKQWVGLTAHDKAVLIDQMWNQAESFEQFMDSIDKFLAEKNT